MKKNEIPIEGDGPIYRKKDLVIVGDDIWEYVGELLEHTQCNCVFLYNFYYSNTCKCMCLYVLIYLQTNSNVRTSIDVQVLFCSHSYLTYV